MTTRRFRGRIELTFLVLGFIFTFTFRHKATLCAIRYGLESDGLMAVEDLAIVIIELVRKNI